MHAQACVCMHMYRAYVRHFKDAYTYAHIRVHTLGFSMVFIFKIIHFNSKKSYIFPKTLSSSQFESNQILNQPWALEFQHHWGTRVRIVRGTECGVYTRQFTLATPTLWYPFLFWWLHSPINYFNLASRSPPPGSDHKAATHLIPYLMSYARILGEVVGFDTKCYKLMGRTHP